MKEMSASSVAVSQGNLGLGCGVFHLLDKGNIAIDDCKIVAKGHGNN